MVIVLAFASGTCTVSACWSASEGNAAVAAINAVLAVVAMWRAIQTHRGNP